jgi:LytS/YehU family sensor histidine kinase
MYASDKLACDPLIPESTDGFSCSRAGTFLAFALLIFSFSNTAAQSLTLGQTASDSTVAKTRIEVLQKKPEDAADLNINLTIIGFVLATSLLGIFITRRRLYATQRLKNELSRRVDERTRVVNVQADQIHRSNLQLRLAVSRARVNSHFVFNVLNAIRYMVLQKEPLQASNHLAKLSSLMRYALETSELEGVPVQKELEMLELYIQLEKARLDNKFDYRIIADISSNVQIPGMLIQPHVESAIIHGLGPVEADGLYLSLRVWHIDDVLRVEVEHNGKSQTTAESNSRSSFDATSSGLDRLQILALLNDKVYNVYQRDLIDSQGNHKGTVVVLDLPIVK